MSEARLRSGFLSEMQRYPNEGWISGVCAGIADYFNWKVQIVRLIAVLLLLCTGWVFVVYCVMWYIMDEGSMQNPNRPNYRYPPPPRGPAASAPSSDGGGGGASPTSPNPAPTATMSELKSRFAKLEERLRNMEECVTSKDFELRRELRRLES